MNFIRQISGRQIFISSTLALLLICSLIPGIISPYNPDQRFRIYLPPEPAHILGTDDMGHDILSGVIHAARISLTIGLLAGVISIGIGVGIGLLAGYMRGVIDEILMSIVDIVLIIPKIPTIILIAAFIRPSVWTLILVLGLLSWESTARVVRSRVIQVRTSAFVKTSEALGFSPAWIMIRDILPIVWPVILPKFMLVTATAMISESSLSFLGLSDPLMHSWGIMISDAYTHGGFVREMWWWYLPPALCIIISVLCFMAIGMTGEINRENGYE